MGLFLLKRLLTLMATLLGASAVVFLVLEILPGNAAQMLMGPMRRPRPWRPWPPNWAWTNRHCSATVTGLAGCWWATWARVTPTAPRC